MYFIPGGLLLNGCALQAGGNTSRKRLFTSRQTTFPFILAKPDNIAGTLLGGQTFRLVVQRDFAQHRYSWGLWLARVKIAAMIAF